MELLFFFSLTAFAIVIAAGWFSFRDNYTGADNKSSGSGGSFSYPKNSREIHAFKAVASRKLKTEREFQCSACAAKEARINLFRMPLGAAVGYPYQAGQIWWHSFSCLNCGLTEIYNYNIAANREIRWLAEASLEPNCACVKCGHPRISAVPLKLSDYGLTRRGDMLRVDYHIRLCLNCGYSDFYQQGDLLSNPGGWKLLQRLNKLAREFRCVKCHSTRANTALIDFINCRGNDGIGGFAGDSAFLLIAVNCEDCKFVRMYDHSTLSA